MMIDIEKLLSEGKTKIEQAFKFIKPFEHLNIKKENLTTMKVFYGLNERVILDNPFVNEYGFRFIYLNTKDGWVSVNPFSLYDIFNKQNLKQLLEGIEWIVILERGFLSSEIRGYAYKTSLNEIVDKILDFEFEQIFD